MSKHAWLDQARCAGEDVNLFFPEGAQVSGDNDQSRYVIKTFCGRCVVRDRCLEAAIEQEPSRHDQVGIRGGMTATQRRQFLKGQQVPA